MTATIFGQCDCDTKSSIYIRCAGKEQQIATNKQENLDENDIFPPKIWHTGEMRYL